MGSNLATCLATTGLPTFVLGEAQAHDPNVLPDHYDQDTKDRMFPQIDAPLPIVNNKDWVAGENECEQENDGSDFKNVDEVKRRGFLRVAPKPRRTTEKGGK